MSAYGSAIKLALATYLSLTMCIYSLTACLERLSLIDILMNSPEALSLSRGFSLLLE
uniref:Uncharacterized protein n=1 Tax=Rhizophora mucronata TaxID=61149 RepID=A0A2P2NG65_RHIMU